MKTHSISYRSTVTKKSSHLGTSPAEHSHHSAEKRHGKPHQIHLLPGDYVISNEDIIISTVLGSCISVCFYSDNSPFCGMNHFMLPESMTAKPADSIMHSDAAFYGINAMEVVINALFKNGINKGELRVKVFGGGNVIPVTNNHKTVGEQNIEFVFEFLKLENIPITACDVGGDFARKILFHTKTKEVFMSHLGHTNDTKIISEEERLRNKNIHMDRISLFSK